MYLVVLPNQPHRIFLTSNCIVMPCSVPINCPAVICLPFMPCCLSKESTSSELWTPVIRPICITIIYHNLPLFIDICLIMRYYLCLFICLCMLDDSWRMDCRSLDSDGKDDVSVQFHKDQKNTRKIWKHIILPEDEGSQKEERRGASGGATPPRHGPT